jgi:hypothetical protein
MDTPLQQESVDVNNCAVERQSVERFGEFALFALGQEVGAFFLLLLIYLLIWFWFGSSGTT